MKRSVTRRPRSHPPAFTPVRLRARRDGWSVEAQCAFLAELYISGSVAAAVRAVGKSRASAYKLRARKDADEFGRAWERALQRADADKDGPVREGSRTRRRKLTLSELRWRALVGRFKPVIYRGKLRAIVQKPNNSALLHLLRRYDAAAQRIARSPP